MTGAAPVAEKMRMVIHQRVAVNGELTEPNGNNRLSDRLGLPAHRTLIQLQASCCSCSVHSNSMQ
jgi:hypothetical protein